MIAGRRMGRKQGRVREQEQHSRKVMPAMSGQLQTMLAAEKPDLLWLLVIALSSLYLAHMFVCLSLACQGPVVTLIGEADLRQEVCGGKC